MPAFSSRSKLQYCPKFKSRRLCGYSGFKLVKEFGAGSFGTVWLLHDFKDNHAFALKAVKVCNSTQKMLVETEIDALCTVRGHPHILEMFEASICDGWALLRFAYCSGGRAVGCVMAVLPRWVELV